MVTRSLAVGAVLAAAGLARADNPLVIHESLSAFDAVAIGFDGPNAPGPSTFYYDLFEIHVDTAGTYTFTMASEAATLAPWIGVYAMNFSAADYFSPAPLDLVAGPGGSTVSMDLLLAPGTYQAIASSVDWIEEPDALDEGAYTVTISGPQGADITLVPGPAAWLVVLAGLVAARRRR